MRIYLLIFILVAVQGLHANPVDIEWHSGSLVLTNNRVYVGEIAIERKLDIVFVKDEGTVTVLPAYRIQSVFYYDRQANINRKFIAVTDQQRAFHAVRLFEIVLFGKLNVIRKELRYADSQNEAYNALGFQYFIQMNDRLVSLRKFRTDIFPILMAEYPIVLHEYIREKRLNSNIQRDAILIIDFYNQLNKDEIMASR